METMLTVKEVAERWDLTPRRVQTLCTSGKLQGVRKFGKSWMIPADAQRPIDRRTKAVRQLHTAGSL